MYATLGKIAATTTSPDVGPDGRPQLLPRSSSRTRGKAWPGLGRTVQVLLLSSQGQGGADGDGEQAAREGLDKLAL